MRICIAIGASAFALLCITGSVWLALGIRATLGL